MANYCEDCGTRTSDGHCPNCDEETDIAQQYRDLGEAVPEVIARAELEQAARRKRLKESKDADK